MTIGRRGVIAAGAGLLLAPRARAADQTIRVGVLTDLSGPYSGTSGPTSVACARQAMQDFGGAGGLRVEILEADHQNKPDVGASIARKWFDDGVDAVADVPNSAVALAVASVAAAKDRACLNSGAASTALTANCPANLVHWGYNTVMLASGATPQVEAGGKSWFFIVPDYVFGRDLVHTATGFIERAGGRVLGSVSYPFPATSDFSSFLLQAQASGADVVAFGNAGSDTVNCVKQAHEFGLAQGGKRVTALLAFIQVIEALGPQTAQGLQLTESFYWDMNSRTRAFMARIRPKLAGGCVSSEQAGTYASVLQYLKAAASLGAPAAKASGSATVGRMKAMPTDDDCYGSIRIRADGQAMAPAYLFRVKSPAESHGKWDLYTLQATIPPEQSNPAEGACKA